MLRRALEIGLAIYLVIGIGGLAPVVSEAIAGAHDDCCADCDDPACPDEEGRECPPQCDDCVCPSWAAPLLAAASAPGLVIPGAGAAPYLTAEAAHEPPLAPGVFRPPRLAS